MTENPQWRRELSRELSRQSNATVRQILEQTELSGSPAQRTGITGPPGAGKSSLIGAIAERRLGQGRKVGVLAVDPTSPVSQGSLLGDRIRMDAVADETGFFVRSVPSGPCHDGLCRNVVGLLDAMERACFDDLILETVGVGQINFDAQTLVDTFVLVLVPDSGDTIQAMKAGILELADIYVVNKADLSGADRLAGELRSVVKWRGAGQSWEPPVIMTSIKDGRGIDDLSAALDAHRRSRSAAGRANARGKRRLYQLRALLTQRLDEIIADGMFDLEASDIARAYEEVLTRLRTVT